MTHGEDGSWDRAPCAEVIAIIDHRYHHCEIPYEDHDDNALGHAFINPERDDGAEAV